MRSRLFLVSIKKKIISLLCGIATYTDAKESYFVHHFLLERIMMYY